MTHCFRPGDNMEAMLRKIPEGLGKVLQDCGRRYVVFNNMASDLRPQVEQLFQMVDSMSRSNGGQVCVTFSFSLLSSVCVYLSLCLSFSLFLSVSFFLCLFLSVSVYLSLFPHSRPLPLPTNLSFLSSSFLSLPLSLPIPNVCLSLSPLTFSD